MQEHAKHIARRMLSIFEQYLYPETVPENSQTL